MFRLYPYHLRKVSHCILISFNLLFIETLGQQPKIDSLNLKLKTAPHDTNQINILNEISKATINIGQHDPAMKNLDKTILLIDGMLKDKSLKPQWRKLTIESAYAYHLKGNVLDRLANYPEAIRYDSIALKLSMDVNDHVGIGNAYNNLGVTRWHQGSMEQAIAHLTLALKERQEVNDKQTIIITLSNMGGVYNSLGKYPDALSYYLKAMKLSEEISDTKMIPVLELNLGTIYQRQGKYEEAINHFLAGLKVFEQTGNKNGMAAICVNLGATYNVIGRSQEALIYYSKALPIMEEVGEPMALATTYNNVSDVYVALGQYTQALDYQTKALAIWNKIDMKEGKIASYLTIGTIYTKQKRFPEAEKILLEANRLSKEINHVDELKESYLQLSNLAEAKGDYLKSLQYYRSYTVVKDSATNEQSNKQMAEMKTAYETEKKDKAIQLLNKEKEVQQKELSRQRVIRNSILGGLAAMILFSVVIFTQKKKIAKEKQRSEELLLNILPAEVAEELKQKGSADAKLIDEVTVLFTDFKGFTQLSEKLSPKELVGEINECFSAFDHIMQRFGVEKIKTIGDAYMAAGGLPTSNTTHADDVVSAALAIQQYMHEHRARKEAEGKLFFEIRIGVHSGSVVAGIVGVKKFAYDIWGDTVNTASRMESSGEAGKVNISGTTYELVKHKFACTHRGKITAKGKGEIDMYFVQEVHNKI